ncbi:hypothetical protein LJC27_05085 [Christensenellaceae bacterium OttesenSCG-928-M15]|nr:hypothetical protein [Christensenellaceae bacterium OttesenSCG-928-M15]
MNESIVKLYHSVFACLKIKGSTERIPLSRAQATNYVAQADAFIQAANQNDEPPGLMQYYAHDNSIREKVRSIRLGAEVINDALHCVAKLECAAPLTAEETENIKEFLAFQLSDGWGTLFDVHPISTEDGDLHISFWDWSTPSYIKTAQELADRKSRSAQGRER